jgi:hypothetical protein
VTEEQRRTVISSASLPPNPGGASSLERASVLLQKDVKRWVLGRLPSNALQALCEQHEVEVSPTGKNGKKNKVDFLDALHAYVSHGCSSSRVPNLIYVACQSSRASVQDTGRAALVTSEGTVHGTSYHADVATEFPRGVRVETPSDSMAMEFERDMQDKTSSDAAMEPEQTQCTAEKRLGIRVYEHPKSWRPLNRLYIIREPDGSVDLDALHRHLTAGVPHIPEKGTLRVSSFSFSWRGVTDKLS